MSVKFRPQRGTLADAMAEVVTVPDLAALKEHLAEKWGGWMTVNLDGLKVEKYPDPNNLEEMDERIGWHTHIVWCPQHGVLGFTDGPLK